VSATGSLRSTVAANRRGERAGITSICSADPSVLEAAVARALEDGSLVCIEATCNQVNQFGGYTGKTPADFRASVVSIAASAGLPESRVALGGDHLGPWVWQDEPAASAMAKARDLVRDYVLAGFTKIHLDASMRCADDPGDPAAFLDEEIATARTAELCRVAEDAHATLPQGSPPPAYVIGTEVPTPGGERADREAPSVTRAEDVERTIALARGAFEREGLQAVWERVIAVVTQPGVEFGDDVVFDYEPERARELSAFIERAEGLVYEAHSTDYQTAATLTRMVEDHFAILKVGPWLTFAMREALFALECIEGELLADRDDVEPSRLREVLETTMVRHPEHWSSYYRGDEARLRLARAFSYSDRCRYYWPRPELREARARLVENLSERPIPLTLLAQFLPTGYEAVRAGAVAARPEELVRFKIAEVLDRYAAACGTG